MATILIIDDDKMICEAVASAALKLEHDAVYALTLADGLRENSLHSFDVIILDVRLPDGNGLQAIPDFQKSPSVPEIIIITGEGDPDGAELAIKNGAWDYIEKPLSVKSITLPLMRTLQYRKEKASSSIVALKREGIIGDSYQMINCLNLLAQAANSEANTLITGETGTGKELFANAIHQNSRRCHKNFVVVDCAALPETLVESTLFGHEKGAFTGADKAQNGLVKIADGGTLFLDEVGELPMSIQKAFLRVLQEKSFRPVGGRQEVKSDFRLISATHRDLGKMVQDGTFRQDLFFRVRSIGIEIPPLRDRKGDIKTLLTSFMTKLCERHGIGTKGFSPELLDMLTDAYSWPGNVRELMGTIESMLATAGDAPTLFPKHLPADFRAIVARSAVKVHNTSLGTINGTCHPDQPLCFFSKYRESVILEAEKRYLLNLMVHASWDIKEACRISDLSRPRLYALLKKHHISRPR